MKRRQAILPSILAGLLLVFGWGISLTAIATTLTVTNLNDSGPGSLRSAISSAANGDTIDATNLTGAIYLTSGELFVSNSMTILGPGPGILFVDGTTKSRVFHVSSNLVVTISGLTISDGRVPAVSTVGGAGIYNNHATLTVTNCAIILNVSNPGGTAHSGSGGGIMNDGSSFGEATLTIVDCIIGHNTTAVRHGAGVYNDGTYGGKATMAIINTTITGNITGTDGGGIYNDGLAGIATLAITNSTIIGNSGLNLGTSGAGIANDGTLTVVGSTLTGNTAGRFGYGGGILNFGTLTIISSTISSNTADMGGGLAINGGTVTIAGSTFVGNSAALHGGGIKNVGTLTMINSTCSGNSATNGGGILNQFELDIANCTFSNNSTVSGGTIFNSFTYAQLDIGSTIVSADTNGACITSDWGPITSLGYNLCSDDGGGFLISTGDQINTAPKLGPLQDNGGPTWTHALLLGSPAIDKGKNLSGSSTDHRGQVRTYDNPGIPNAASGDSTDIGAFEFMPPALGITPNYGNVILSWPAEESGYTVEATTLLGNAAIWTTVPGTPIVIDNQCLLGDGPATGTKFYRLKSP